MLLGTSGGPGGVAADGEAGALHWWTGFELFSRERTGRPTLLELMVDPGACTPRLHLSDLVQAHVAS